MSVIPPTPAGRHPRRSPTSTAAQLRSFADHLRAAFTGRLLGMLDEEESHRRGIRARRALPVAGGGLAAMVAMLGLVSNNALALGMQTASRPHYIFANSLKGSNAAVFVAGQQVGSGTEAATQIGFRSAKLHGFCMLAPQQIAGVGLVTLRLTAGEPVDGTPDANGAVISAENLFTAAKSVVADGDEITRLTLGQSADTVSDTAGIDPKMGFTGPAGGFGIAATTMNLSDFQAENYGLDLRGSINLPGLHIDLLPGTKQTMEACR